MKPWREIAVPHQDVLVGTFQQAEFAADLMAVHQGKADPTYQDPTAFFQRTFITEGMRLLLTSVAQRLNGGGGDPVMQLQTAFGGGKTHTMLAVYHLAKGGYATKDLAGVSSLLDQAGLAGIPACRIAVLVNDLVRHRLHLALVYASLPLFRSRMTWHDAPASVRQAYTLREMQSLFEQTDAAQVEIRKHYLFRMGAIAWKKRESPCTT